MATNDLHSPDHLRPMALQHVQDGYTAHTTQLLTTFCGLDADGLVRLVLPWHAAPERTQRWAAVEILRGLSTASALAALHRFLDTDDRGLRLAVVTWLTATGTLDLCWLSTALTAESVHRRSSAAMVLARQPDSQYCAALQTLLSDASWEVRYDGIHALGALADPTIPKLFLNYVDDESEAVQCEIMRQFGYHRSVQALPVLIAKLTDPSAGIRMAASEALGTIRDPQATMPLIALLDDLDMGVRQVVCFAVGRIGDPRSIPGLIGASVDKNPHVRFYVAQALGQFRTPEVQQVLLQLAGDPVDFVRDMANRQQGKIYR